MSNTRLDLQTGSDYFSDFPVNVLIVRLLLGLFFFTVLIPNNLKSNTFLFFPFLHKSCKQNVLLCFCTVKPFFSVAIFFCLQKKHFVYVIFFISVRFFYRYQYVFIDFSAVLDYCTGHWICLF